MENTLKFALRKYQDTSKKGHFTQYKPLEIVAYGDDHEELVKIAKAMENELFGYSVEFNKAVTIEPKKELTKLELLNRLLKDGHITFREGCMLQDN